MSIFEPQTHTMKTGELLLVRSARIEDAAKSWI